MQDIDIFQLPSGYDDNKIVLLARDPHWLYAYWEISEAKKSSFINEFGEKLWEKSVPVIKISNVSKNISNYIRINDFSNNWFINVENANSLYVAELGRRVSDQFYISLASSNYIFTPGNSISKNTGACFVNYKDLREGKFEPESGLIYDSMYTQKNMSIGFSSIEFFENRNETYSGNLVQHLGFSSLNLIK